MWWRQFKKEWLGHRGETAILVGALAVWTAFLYTRAGAWPPYVIFPLYWGPCAGFLPLWAIWTSVQLYRQEWRENASYLMLSLPVRARTITSAKLAVLATWVIGFSLLIAAGGIALASRFGAQAIWQADLFSLVPSGWVAKMALLGYAAMIGGIVVAGLIAQFAYVFSRLFSRFQGLVVAWTWLLTVWLMGRVGDLGGRLLSWMPDFHLPVADWSNGVVGVRAIAVESGPFWALGLFVVGLYALLNLTLERAVEV